MKKRRISSPQVIGGNTLLLIFAVLCLTVLTLLMISTALSDRRLSVVSADAVSAYYAADYEAETVFSMLREGNIPSFVSEKDGYYSYECDISNTQKLSVELLFENDEWKIISWRTTSLEH